METLKTRRIDLVSLVGKTDVTRVPPEGGARSAGAAGYGDGFDYRVLFENSYDAILVAEETGKILASNRRGHMFFRDAPEEVPGAGLLQLIPGVTPELLASIVETVAARRFTVLQAWCQRFDDTLFPAEIVVTGFQMRDKRVLFLQIRDATVRRASEERLLSITRALDTAAVGIATADLDGKITYANPYLAGKLGFEKAEDLRSRSLTLLVGAEDLCRVIIDSIRDNRVWSDEISLVVGGEVVWLQIDAAPHQDSEGVLTGMVLSVRDMGLRKRAEAAEYRASRNRLLVESMSATCHMLGQPATVLLSSLDLIRTREKPDPEMDETLFDMVFEAADEMRGILQEMHAKSIVMSEDASDGATEAPAESEMPLDRTE